MEGHRFIFLWRKPNNTPKGVLLPYEAIRPHRFYRSREVYRPGKYYVCGTPIFVSLKPIFTGVE